MYSIQIVSRTIRYLYSLLYISIFAITGTAQDKKSDPTDEQMIVERETELEKLKGRDPELEIWNRYLDAKEKAYSYYKNNVKPDIEEYQRLEISKY